MTRKTPLRPPKTPVNTPTRSRGAYLGPPNQVSGTSSADGELVARAYRSLMNKQDLSPAERAALKRHEKEREERLRWQYYASIPQRHWREMSGRQSKVLNEQAERYGLPLGGPTINLPALARAFHQFLADNAAKLAREEDDHLMTGSNSPALESYRQERTLIVRLDRLHKQGQLVPRDHSRLALGRIAAVLRGAGDALQQQFGPAAREILDEAMDEAEAEIDRTYGSDASAYVGDGSTSPEEPDREQSDMDEADEDEPAA